MRQILEREDRPDRHMHREHRLDFVVECQADRDASAPEVEVYDRKDGRCRVALPRGANGEDLRLHHEQDARPRHLEDQHAFDVDDEPSVHRAEHGAEPDRPAVYFRFPAGDVGRVAVNPRQPVQRRNRIALVFVALMVKGEEAAETIDAETGTAERDRNGEIHLQCDQNRGRLAGGILLVDHMADRQAAGDAHAEAWQGHVDLPGETIVVDRQITAAFDGARDIDVDAKRAHRRCMPAFERNANGRLVDRDDAEIRLEVQVELDIDRVGAGNAGTSDLQYIPERAGHRDAAAAWNV